VTELVLDIETIPAEQEVLDQYCSFFPRKKKPKETPALHPCTARVVAVGLKPVGGEPVVFMSTEREILESTKSYLEEVRPTKIISFNGTAFDFPMLRFRAAAHHVEGLGRLLPTARSSRNCDLFHLIKWEMPLTLSELSMLVLGRPKELSGADVAELYRMGDLDAIRQYNIHDLEIIEALYLLREDLFGPGVL